MIPRIALFILLTIQLSAQINIRTEFFFQYDNIHSAAPTPHGDFIISGWRDEHKPFLAEVNSEGHVLWEKASNEVVGLAALKNQKIFILSASGAYEILEFGPLGSGESGSVSSRPDGYYPGAFLTEEYIVVPVLFRLHTWDFHFFSREDGRQLFKKRRIGESCDSQFFYHQKDELIYELRCVNGSWTLSVYDMVDRNLLRQDSLHTPMTHINAWTFHNNQIYLAGMTDQKASLMKVDLTGKNPLTIPIDWVALQSVDSVSVWEVIESYQDALILGGKRREKKPNFVYDSEVLVIMIQSDGTIIDKRIMDIGGDASLSISMLFDRTWTLMGPANITDHNGGYIPPSFITTISLPSTTSNQDHFFNQLEIVPNPTDGQLSVNATQSAFPMTLYNETGSVVGKWFQPGQKDISDLQKGIYFLISAHSGYSSQKIVKQ